MSPIPPIPTAENGLEWLLSRGNGALAERMGFEWIACDPQRCIARMPVEGNTQPVGLVHGGAYVVLGESLGSMHSNYLLALSGSEDLAVGVDINATHTRSATAGWVTGTCTPLHVGRSLFVHEIVLSDEAGRRLSTVRITNLVKRRPA